MSLGFGSRVGGPSNVQNRRSHIHLENVRTDTKIQAATFLDNAHDTVEAATQSPTRRDDFTFRPDAPQTDVPPMGRQRSLPSTEPLLMSKVDFNSVKLDSPWKTYEKGFELQFDQIVTVAVRRAPRSGRVAIKEYSDRDASRKLEMLKKVSHEKCVQVLDVFEHHKRCYIVFEHILVSLTEVVACPAYPTQQQLVAILAQVS